MNSLYLQLLRVFGNTVGVQFDFVAGTVTRILADLRTDDFFTLTLVEHTS